MRKDQVSAVYDDGIAWPDRQQARRDGIGAYPIGTEAASASNLATHIKQAFGHSSLLIFRNAFIFISPFR